MNKLKEIKELISDVNKSLNGFKRKADAMALNAEYTNGKILNNLSDAIERSIQDVRRNTSESNYRL